MQKFTIQLPFCGIRAAEKIQTRSGNFVIRLQLQKGPDLVFIQSSDGERRLTKNERLKNENLSYKDWSRYLHKWKDSNGQPVRTCNLNVIDFVHAFHNGKNVIKELKNSSSFRRTRVRPVPSSFTRSGKRKIPKKMMCV